MTDLRHLHAARDRLRARPLRRRPARGQARRRDRAAQPLAPPAGRRRAARRDRAEEHHHDRADRRREDRDRAPAREARAGAVPEGRGVEVHRGRLRRARRRVDRARSRRARRAAGAPRRRSARCAPRPRSAPRSACSTRCCRATPSAAPSDAEPPRRRRRDAREAAQDAAPGPARRPRDRGRAGRRRRNAADVDLHAAGRRGDGRPVQGPARQLLPEEDARAGSCEIPAAREALHRRGGDAARRRRRACASCAIERVEQTGIVFIDEIDKIAAPARGGKHGPDVSREGVQRDLLPIVEGSTVHDQARRRCAPTTSCSSPPAPSTSRSRRDLIPELQGRFPIRVELRASAAGGLRADPDRAATTR